MTGPADQALGNLDRSVESLDRQLTATSERWGRLRDLGNVAADVRGTADSEDGYVHVEWAQRGLAELTIAPRAMRLVSEDLAEAIKTTIEAAVADFQAQTLAALHDADLMPDPAEVESSMTEAREQFGAAQQELTRSLRSAVEMLSQANRRQG